MIAPPSEPQNAPRRGLGRRLAEALGDVAPTVAGALGGPLAGAAASSLSKAIFGKEGGAPEAMEAAILAGDPETLVRIREVEASFRRAIIDADLEAHRIAAGDRANARARQIAVRDMTPTILGLSVIGGFFFVLTIMLWRELPARAETEFSIMLGALATMTAAVVNYYFGSSVGSREKTQILAKTPGNTLR